MTKNENDFSLIWKNNFKTLQLHFNKKDLGGHLSQ